MQLGKLGSWLPLHWGGLSHASPASEGPREVFESGSQSQPPTGLQRLTNQVLTWAGAGDLLVSLREELSKINELEVQAQQLKTPEQFAAKTAELKARLAAGESLDSLRNEAYAVARQACSAALKMRPYDAQMLGALAMDRGRIAEMKTGEGKTMTAVMPAYLNALAGKGVHVITANETLAQRDCQKMAPVFEMLGLKAQPVLETMESEQKRASYQADVTYLTNSTLGFDYLRDQMVRDPKQRVQRDPFFALVDEVDEVLIDEARTPLILSQASRDQEGPAQAERFSHIVADMQAGQDFQIDSIKNSAFLTETGQDWLSNRLGIDKEQCRLQRLKKNRSPRAKLIKAAAKQRLAVAKQIGRLIRKEQSLQEKSDPQALEQVQEQKRSLQEKFSGVNIYHPSQMSQVRALQNALAARGLYRLDKHYSVALEPELEQALGQLCQQAGMQSTQTNQAKWLVMAHQMGLEPNPETIPELLQHGSQLDSVLAQAADENGLKAPALLQQVYLKHGQLKIVDEFKGRIAEGRRFNGGLHQALEAKEGLDVQPEQRTAASITYPNLFGRYPRLAGMSGTAKSSEKEFKDLYGLEVAEIPTHKRSQLVQESDRIFATEKEKLEAVVAEALRCYEEGIPLLIGTRSVEKNQELTQMLRKAGIPCQSISAESIKSNTAKENAMLERAGQCGWVTVATNMAGRGVDIKEDQVSYKKAALAAAKLAGEHSTVVVEVASPEQAQRLQQWLDLGNSQGITIEVADQPQQNLGHDGWNLPGLASTAKRLKLSDFPTGGLRVLGTERHASPRIDGQLIGRAARQGRPGSGLFMLSLEDELFRQAGDALPSIDKLDEQKLKKLIAQCQQRIEDCDSQAREQTTKFDGALNIQRKVLHELRQSIVEVSANDGAEDILATAGDWIEEAGPAKTQPCSQRQEFEDLVRQLTEMGTFSPQQLADYCRTTMLDAIDEEWSNHLETMESLKDAAQLQGDEEHKPADIYQKLAFEAFVEFKNDFQSQARDRLLDGFHKTLDMARRLKA